MARSHALTILLGAGSAPRTGDALSMQGDGLPCCLKGHRGVWLLLTLLGHSKVDKVHTGKITYTWNFGLKSG